MRNFILDPIVLPVIIGIYVTYLFLVIRSTRHKQVARLVEPITIVLLLILLLKPIIPPLTYLQFDALVGRDKTLESLVLQLSIYAFFIVGNRRLFYRFSQSLGLLFLDPFLGALLVLVLLSGLCSETPLLSLRFGLVQFGVSWLAAHIANRHDWQAINKYVCWMCLIAGILSVFVAIAVPTIGVHEKGWQGIFPFSIKLGTCMALSVVLWLIQPVKTYWERMLSIMAIALSLLLIFLANSVQAILTLITLMVILQLIVVMRIFTVRQAVFATLVVILLSFYSYVVITANLETIFDALGKDMTLTGRTEFWPQMLTALQERPILGYGMQGFWQDWRGEENPAGHIINHNGFVPPNGHNGFLDLAMDLGWLGLFIFSLSFGLNLIKSVGLLKRKRFVEAALPLTLLTYLVMANISETQLLITYYVWFLYVVVAVKLNAPKVEASKQGFLLIRNT